ncbi:DUF6768 family protein [Phenylobacterium sp.]|uniref:DUF6768 family protein n=1 Tax=Phenylobacterium sp. TaxID=1871053 RepID=UPI00273495EB|nr:DUF6768 family protein [Phenylobacterium sp.]MDP3853875.1 hypothetical protein [Phenylobacterium sp.]
MTEIDERLRASLSADDEAFLDGLDRERTLFAQLGETFKGPMRNWTIVANVAAIIAAVIGVWCVWRMIEAETTRGLILWAAAGWAAWTVQITVKQWILQRMQMLGILRELKRLELRLARLEP